MNRNQHSALISQYAAPEVSGGGLVSWEGGKKCGIPSVKLYGAAVQDGTPTPDAPVTPVCNNGTFAARGRNLAKLYPGFGTYGSNVTNTVVRSGVGDEYISCCACVVPGETYILSFDYDSFPTSSRYFFFTDDPTLPENVNRLISLTGQYLSKANYKAQRILQTPDGAQYLFWQIAENRSVSNPRNIQIVRGSEDKPYAPCYDGGQVQAPELRAIPGTSFRDEWDCRTGKGIRRVKKRVLDGSEEWTYFPDKMLFVTQLEGIMYSAPNVVNPGLLCSHFAYESSIYDDAAIPCGCAELMALTLFRNLSCSTLDDWIAYLKAQDAAGTPVTVWYALATPEPFYSPPTKLTMPTGFGQIIQVSGDIPDCPITARYLTHS